MTARAAGSRFVSSRNATSPSAGSGVVESTVCPSTSAAMVALAKPAPISARDSIGRTRWEYSRTEPSGSFTLSMGCRTCWDLKPNACDSV